MDSMHRLIDALWGRGTDLADSFAGVITRTLRVCTLPDGDRKGYVHVIEREAGTRIGHRIRDVRTAVLGAYREATAGMDAGGDVGGGFRQEDVALVLDMSPSAYQKAEQSGTGLTAGRLAVLADLYGVPAEVIVSPLEGDALADEAEVVRCMRRMSPGQLHALARVARAFTEATHSQEYCE